MTAMCSCDHQTYLTILRLLLAALFCVSIPTADTQLLAQSLSYPWLSAYDSAQCVAARFPAPAGYTRVPAAQGSFGDWLRHLPLQPGLPPVLLYNGEKKALQDAHCAVVDIDVGNRDLQQCADAIIRLRAEYLYSRGRIDSIRFTFTSGDTAYLSRWFLGDRPLVSNNHVRWKRQTECTHGYQSFREYLDCVFTYAGTQSLERELRKVTDPRDLRIGDVFIIPGFPGHAVIVVDLAHNPDSGEKIFLLAQSYTPAQSIHVLRNLADSSLDPWYHLSPGDTLDVCGWLFTERHLRRF